MMTLFVDCGQFSYLILCPIYLQKWLASEKEQGIWSIRSRRLHRVGVGTSEPWARESAMLNLDVGHLRKN